MLDGEKLYLDQIENITQLIDDIKVLGTLIITNYKISFVADRECQYDLSYVNFEIPIASIRNVKKVGQKLLTDIALKVKNIVKISTKYFRDIVLQFPMNSPTIKVFTNAMDSLCKYKGKERSFSYYNQEDKEIKNDPKKNGWNIFDYVDDWKRFMNLTSDDWKMNNINESYTLTSTYPQTLIVPNSLNYNQLKKSSLSKEYGQFPITIWISPHGASLSRCLSDLNDSSETKIVLRSIALKNPINKEIVIYDMNKSSTSEDTYKTIYIGISNNSSIHEAYTLFIHSLFKDNISDQFEWRMIVSNILEQAYRISKNLYNNHTSIVLQGSKKNLSHVPILSLVQLICDPFYRTIYGLCSLIDKDWIQFTYPFKNINTNDKPLYHFELFLYCLWSLIKAFPSLFEYTTNIIEFLFYSLYSDRFGTFLVNNHIDIMMMKEKTVSIWSYILMNKDKFKNKYYEPSEERILLDLNVIAKKPSIWNPLKYNGALLHQKMIALKDLKENATVFNINQSINVLFELPFNVNHFKSLKAVHFKNNKLEYMPHEIFELEELEELSLSNNPIKVIPENWIECAGKYLKKLKNLSLDGCQLISYPSTLHIHLQSLRKLYLRENNIDINFTNSIIATDIEFKLNMVDLSQNNLFSLPKNFNHIRTILFLNISDNSFVNIPSQLYHMVNLENIDLSNNNIKVLSFESRDLDLERIDAQALVESSIQHMNNSDLTANKNINQSNSFFTRFKMIKTLLLHGNQIEQITDDIGSLRYLQCLDLSNNKIKDIPFSISKLVSLEKLLLQNNMITSISFGIGNLKNLQYLDISNNQINILPPQLGMLKDKLNVFEFKGNDIISPPPEITNLGSQETLNFLFDILHGSKSVYKMKIMVVGEENVGKTTIVDQLVRRWNSFTQEDFTPITTLSTDGIDINQCTFIWKNEGDMMIDRYKEGESFDVNINFWDFAGQEIYYTTHQFFLSERSIYLVLWNLERHIDESRVEYWLHSIQSKASGAQVIIVGTHLDGIKKDQRNELTEFLKRKRVYFRQTFPQLNISFNMVSCKTGEGMNDFKIDLEKKIVTSKFIGETLPISYILLENIVMEKRKNINPPVITRQEFINLGRLCNITEENELFRASTFLHNLGSLIYFDKDPVLNQYVILEPQWLAKVMSSLISTKTNVSGGLIPHSLIKQAWMNYPYEIYPFLLSLLEKFEVIYNLTGYIESQGVFESNINKGSIDSSYQKTKELKNFLLSKVKYLKKHITGIKENKAFIKESSPQRPTTVLFKDSSPKFKFAKIPNHKRSEALIGNSLKRKEHSKSLIKESNEGLSSLRSSGSENMSNSKNSSYYDGFNPKGTTLVPCMLPECKPDEVTEEKWSKFPSNKEYEVNRIWRVSNFIPNGLFSRLIVRFLQNFLNHDADAIFWKDRILILKERFKLQVSLEEEGTDKVLSLYVRSLDFKEAAIAFCGAIESISFLFREWNHLDVTINIKCPYCRSKKIENPVMWDMNEVIGYIKEGKDSITNEYLGKTYKVPLESLTPDLKLVYLSDISIPYNELKHEKEVGQGGFAIVYKGNYKGKEVAIKELKLDNRDLGSSEDYSNAFNDFRTETFIMTDINNPYCVKMLGVCFEPFCIVTEFLPHGNLYDLCNDTDKYPTFSWNLKLKIALDIARGMAYLHSKNPPIVHNDLKSPNILLCSLDENAEVCAKISDFGLSQKVSKIYKRLVDTPTWVAPEIMMGKIYDYKADVYAYGVILWEMLERKHYFGDVDFNSEIEHLVMRGERPQITQHYLIEYERMMKICWDNDPIKRPSFDTIVNFFEDLIEKFNNKETVLVDPSKVSIHTWSLPTSYRKKYKSKENNNTQSSPIEEKIQQKSTFITAKKPCKEISNTKDEDDLRHQNFTRQKTRINIGRSSFHNKKEPVHESEPIDINEEKITSSNDDITQCPLSVEGKNDEDSLVQISQPIEQPQQEHNEPPQEKATLKQDNDIIKKNIKYISLDDSLTNLDTLKASTKELIKLSHDFILTFKNSNFQSLPHKREILIGYIPQFKSYSNSIIGIRTWDEEKNKEITQLHQKVKEVLDNINEICEASHDLTSKSSIFISMSNKLALQFKDLFITLNKIDFKTGQTVLEIHSNYQV